MHTLLVTAKLIIIEVINDNVVWTCLTVTQTTRRLTTTTGKELHAVLGLKLTFLPVASVFLCAKVGNDALVVLQFSLDVAKQTDGTILGLANYHHEVNQTLGLKHQPQRSKNVHVGGLGMTTRPHKDRFEVRRVLHLLCSLIVKRRIVYGSDYFACSLISQL